MSRSIKIGALTITSTLTDEELNWSQKGLCRCGHTHLSHHLKKPHRCNGEWRPAPEPWLSCDCTGFEVVKVKA